MNNIGNNLLKEAKNYVDTIIWNGRNFKNKRYKSLRNRLY